MTFTQIKNQVYRLTKTNSTSFDIDDLTEEINIAVRKTVTKIMNADGRWQFSDSNHPDLDSATTALVANQQDYTLDISHITIDRIELLTESSSWIKLIPIDQADLYDTALTSFLSAAGTPMYYDKIGVSLLLYPKPDYAQESSLRVYYKRPPTEFEITDSDETPGFNELFHELVALYVSENYAVANMPKLLNGIQRKIERMEDDMVSFYALRSKDEHLGLRVRQHSMSAFR